MASPQLENGHVDIANELVEAFAKIRISGTEMQLVWVILRKTYGWHKKEDAISLSQFVEMTSIPKPDVIRYLKKLLGKKIICIGQNDNGIKIYSINKDFETWEPLGKKITLGKNPTIVGQKDNKSLGKKIPTKETTKEKKERVKLSIPPDIEDVEEYCDQRRNGINVQVWYDFYSAKGWMIGKNKMVDWKAAIRTWEKDKPKRPDNYFADMRDAL